jgi:hypothetical protein
MLLVNDTGVDIRDLGIEAAIRKSIATGDGLPEEIADLFSVNVIEVDGEKRAIVDWM